MDVMQIFGTYAAEFEKTFEDDDWTRLERFFAPDVRYVVAGSPFDCELVGRDAVLAGIRLALDTFDRKFEGREIAPNGPPVVEGRRVTLSADLTYTHPDTKPLTFSLSEYADFDDEGRIVHLQDDYDPGQDHVDAWLAESGAPARLIMQVHDELVLEVEAAALDETRAEIVRLMNSAAELAVPLKVDAGSGFNWDEAH